MPAPTIRRIRNTFNANVPGWWQSQLLASHQAALEPTLDMVLYDYRRTRSEVFVLQVGAFDGVSNDPLHDLIGRHCLRGVLVEPQAAPFQRLTEHYRGLPFRCINAAISDKSGTMPFYCVKPDVGLEWLPQLASFNRDVILKHAETVPNIESLIEVVPVRTLSFDDLFTQAKIRHVDFLQVDAEGFDAEILRLFDVPRRRPAIVRFEHAHLERGMHERCAQLLIGEGYKIFFEEHDTLAYLGSNE